MSSGNRGWQLYPPSISAVIYQAAHALRDGRTDLLANSLASCDVESHEIAATGEMYGKGRHPRIVMRAYSPGVERRIKDQAKTIETAIQAVLGGTGVTVEVVLAEDDWDWSAAQTQASGLRGQRVRPVRHFDPVRTPRWPVDQGKQGAVLRCALMMMLARHTRWSVTVATSQHDVNADRRMRLTWWVSEWAQNHLLACHASAHGTARPTADEFENQLVRHSKALVGKSLDMEYLPQADPDDFGQIDRTFDKLTMVVIGPFTMTAGTWLDVRSVTGLAGDVLTVRERSAGRWSLDGCPIGPYLLPLTGLVQEVQVDTAKRPDVALVFRGGFNQNDINDGNLEVFQDHCRQLRNLGVEVVLGMGHGDYTVFEGNAPVGVYEATTPTSAALWVLRHHLGLSL